MAKPPILSGREVVTALKRAGYVQVGQKGSHIKLWHPGTHSILIIPDHKAVDRWTLKGVLHSAEISVEEFLDYL